MPRRIEEDHKEFKDVYSGRIRKELGRFIKDGQIFKKRGKNGKIVITIPKIDIPHIVYGNTDGGIGRGPGKKGDVIGKVPDQDGEGGDEAGEEHKDGITIAIDMEEIFQFLKDDLCLPDLKPKANQTFEEIKIKYNNISMQGPESLRHNRRTMLQALKRMCATGEINQLHQIPGFADPVRLIVPINADKRYRQFKEIRVPSSNAVIFFARDGSGSMDEYKCDIASDMAFWIDAWIRRFYNKVERCYVWHDTEATLVDEQKFYNYRYGGGTVCSSALKLINQQLKHRYPPEKWNVYVIYFTDGENTHGDNEVFNSVLQNDFTPEIVNMAGVVQITPYLPAFTDEDGLLIGDLQKHKHADNIRFASIADIRSEEERGQRIKEAVKKILGKNPVEVEAKQ